MVNMPPRSAPSICGGSRADSMVGFTALTENPAGYRTTCVTREICKQGMCASYYLAGVGSKLQFKPGVGRKASHGTWHTQVLGFDCQITKAGCDSSPAWCSRSGARARPFSASAVVTHRLGRRAVDELLHENAAARTLTRLLPRRRRHRLVRVEALAIGKRLARFDKRCIRRGIDIAPCKSTKHLIVLRQALLKSLIVRAVLSGVPVHPLTLDDRGERCDGHAGGDAYGTHARAARVLHAGGAALRFWSTSTLELEDLHNEYTQHVSSTAVKTIQNKKARPHMRHMQMEIFTVYGLTNPRACLVNSSSQMESLIQHACWPWV